MARVLYITYTGILQPLGQSQVLQYLGPLAKQHSIILLSFERPEDLKESKDLRQAQDRCRGAGIRWIRLRYHKWPSLPATMFDVLNGLLIGLWIALRHRIEIVHARSYIPGLIGLIVSRLPGRRFLFDMRGFWPDERVDGGIWRSSSWIYRLAKTLERWLLSTADVVVSLTHAGVREMKQLAYLQSHRPRFEVIPTCTNLDLFQPPDDPRRPEDNALTLGYIGSAGTWYMFPEVAACFRILLGLRPKARLLILNRSEHDYVRDCLARAGVSEHQFEICAVSHSDVAANLASVDAGIFFIKPVFSKSASCPTKLGEFLACGKPCLANSNVGDVEAVLNQTKTGVCLNQFSDDAYRKALEDLLALVDDPQIADRCTDAARLHFSLEHGVRRYDQIYRDLSVSENV